MKLPSTLEFAENCSMVCLYVLVQEFPLSVKKLPILVQELPVLL